MAHEEQRRILKTLKLILKKKGITYGDLSESVGISESSIKRIMSGSDCRLSFLNTVCRVLDISIYELMESARGNRNEFYRLSEQQEFLFAEEPNVYAVFVDLYSGKSISEVSNIWNLRRVEISQILKKLEKVELLEVHPRDRIKFKARGRITWQPNGHLFRKLFKKQNEQFLNKVYKNIEDSRVLFQSSELKMVPETYQSMMIELKELGQKYRILAYQEERTLPSEAVESYRWLFSMCSYETNWLRYKGR